MRNHYDMQREVVEAARSLIDDALCGKMSGLEAYWRLLNESKRRFSETEFSCLREIGERVSKLRTLKAEYDKTDDGEVETICGEVETEEQSLRDQRETLDTLFKRLQK